MFIIRVIILLHVTWSLDTLSVKSGYLLVTYGCCRLSSTWTKYSSKVQAFRFTICWDFFSFLLREADQRSQQTSSLSVLFFFSSLKKKKPTVSCPTIITDPERYIKLLSIVIVHCNKIIVLQINYKTSYQDIAHYHYWGISETQFISFSMGQSQSLSYWTQILLLKSVESSA